VDTERRRHKRYRVANVEGTLVFKSDARVLNVSVAGLTVETTQALRVGRPITITLATEREPLRLAGVVARCRLVATRAVGGEEQPVYQAGIRLEGMLSETAQRFLGFIESHVRIELERRVFGRFTLASGDTVMVEPAAEFQVAVISMSGMRVECDAGPEAEAVVEVEIRLNGSAIRVRARVVATASAGDEPRRHVVDLEFAELAEAERTKLEAFIRREVESAG
jgi:hypothetical protein